MVTTAFSTFSLHLLPPVHPTTLVYLTFTKCHTSSLTYLSHPFITSFLHLSPPLSQTQGWVHDSADFKKKLHSFVGVENYVFCHLHSGR